MQDETQGGTYKKATEGITQSTVNLTVPTSRLVGTSRLVTNFFTTHFTPQSSILNY